MSMKDEWLRQSDLQWSPGPDRYVCAECVCDEALAMVVEGHLESDHCDYCERSSEEDIAAPLSAVTEHMAECINARWTDPVNELMYISKEGGYQGEVLDAWEVFELIGYQPDNMDLWDDILKSFSDGHWCKKDYGLLSVDERLRSGWSQFVTVVKHERRFTFWSMGDPHAHPVSDRHPDDTPVGTMLDEIAECIRRAELFREVPISASIWRVRVHDKSEKLTSAHDFAAPPRELATQPNRLSPAGIPMFYGAEDWATACAETFDQHRANGKQVSGAQFTPVRPLRVLDLLGVPSVPSFWEHGLDDLRETIIFLRAFENDMARPITRGRVEHIEYVPTQAFSEYVRYQMKTEDGDGIDGIRFRSSRTGKACYVIFCEHDQCIERNGGFRTRTAEQLLRFDSTSLRSDDAEKLASEGGG